MFVQRLKEYRESLGLTKREMSAKLEVSESYYNVIESGKRAVSRNVIEKLALMSAKPEEYWIYGISESEYLSIRQDLKSTKRALEQLIEFNLIDNVEDLFKDNNRTIEKLLIAALKSDISYMIDKKKGGK